MKTLFTYDRLTVVEAPLCACVVDSITTSTYEILTYQKRNDSMWASINSNFMQELNWPIVLTDQQVERMILGLMPKLSSDQAPLINSPMFGTSIGFYFDNDEVWYERFFTGDLASDIWFRMRTPERSPANLWPDSFSNNTYEYIKEGNIPTWLNG